MLKLLSSSVLDFEALSYVCVCVQTTIKTVYPKRPTVTKYKSSWALVPPTPDVCVCVSFPVFPPLLKKNTGNVRCAVKRYQPAHGSLTTLHFVVCILCDGNRRVAAVL